MNKELFREEIIYSVGDSNLEENSYGENRSFLEIERFRKIQGEGKGMILMKGNTPVYVRLFKKDSIDKNGKPVTENYSYEFRRMLGYHDTLDFPNTLAAWIRYLHPDDKDQAVQQLNKALQDRSNETKYNVEYRMKMADARCQKWMGLRQPDRSGIVLEMM